MDIRGTQASIFIVLKEKEAAEKIGEICKEDMKKTGILASISAAQFILESGYGKTGLAQAANNVFGMKCSLSGNTWNGSTWDGVSICTRETKEQTADGTEYTVTADFRKYPCIEDSLADHSAYLISAMNGDKLRYEGIKGMTNYREVAQLIKNGGYATDVKYVDKLCNIIERFNLTQYDVIEVNNTEPDPKLEIKYYVQVGAYSLKKNADRQLERAKNAGFDDAFIKDIDGLYKVQVGAYAIRENAEKQLERAKNAGFDDAFIKTI